MKVLIMIPTYREVPKECWDSVINQDYQDFDILINKKEQRHEDRAFDIIDNRNEIREKALETDAEYFLFVDDDVVIPRDTISNLITQMDRKCTTMDFPGGDGKIIPKGTPIPEKFIVGGWYQHRDGSWNCGKWVADNTFINFKHPEKSVIRVDKIDMGCILLKREVLEKVKFRLEPERKMNNNRYLCSCLMFAIDAQDAGYDLWMSGDVICEHLKKKEEVCVN
jgi:glycosyltransferase involved in cell wall biosynthesis